MDTTETHSWIENDNFSVFFLTHKQLILVPNVHQPKAGFHDFQKIIN